MVYIQDGKVVEQRPWNFQLVSNIFWGFFDLVSQFFRTLVGLDRTGSGRGGGNSRGSGPGGPGGPGGPRNRGPRGMKDISSIQDCSMPGGG